MNIPKGDLERLAGQIISANPLLFAGTGVSEYNEPQLVSTLRQFALYSLMIGASGFGAPAVVVPVTTFPYTVQAGDIGTVLLLMTGSAGQVIVPAGLGAGFHCGFIQGGVGVITFAGDGTSTVANRAGNLKTAGTNAPGSLIAKTPNNFVLAGDLTA